MLVAIHRYIITFQFLKKNENRPFLYNSMHFVLGRIALFYMFSKIATQAPEHFHDFEIPFPWERSFPIA